MKTNKQIFESQQKRNRQVALARRLREGQSLDEALACMVALAYGNGLRKAEELARLGRVHVGP